MNPKIVSLLPKAFVLSGALFLGLGAFAQSTANNNMTSDSTRRTMHRHWAGHNGNDSLAARRGPGDQDGFRRGDHGGEGWAGGRSDHGGWRQRGQGREGFRHGREFNNGVHYTPEQRKQATAINREYHQRSADLFNKDNSTLKEYKAALIALQKEKKAKLEALLTPQQKDQMASRRRKMSENMQVIAAARMERLKIRLSLSDDQVAKIKSGEANLHAQVKAIHENDNLLPQQKMEQMKDLMAKRKEIIKSVLTPDQRSRLEEMSRHRPGPGGHGGFRGTERGEHMDDQQTK